MKKHIFFFTLLLVFFLLLPSKETSKKNSESPTQKIIKSKQIKTSKEPSIYKEKTPTEPTKPKTPSLSDKEFYENEVKYARTELENSELVFCHATEIEIFNELSQRENPVPVPVSISEPHSSDYRLRICKEGLVSFTSDTCLTSKKYCPFNYYFAREEELVYFMEVEDVITYLQKREDLQLYISDPFQSFSIDQAYWSKKSQELTYLQNRVLGR